jgi:hypothetical protein
LQAVSKKTAICIFWLLKKLRQKNKDIAGYFAQFFLIVDFYCASRSASLREKVPFQVSKQAG